MKLYVLFERLYDANYWEFDGLGAALGACFDEEQAKEIARVRTLAFWRSKPPENALKSLGYFLKHMGYGDDVIAEDELFWILLESGDDYDRALFVVVDVVAVDVTALPRARLDRLGALARMADLLAPWSKHAAQALREDA